MSCFIQCRDFPIIGQISCTEFNKYAVLPVLIFHGHSFHAVSLAMSMFAGLEYLVPEPPLSYRYAPLDDMKRQVRLMHVLPGTSRRRPRCRIQIASLDENPQFVALSYAWGTSKNRKRIEVDGRALFVTKNLFEALVQIQCDLEPYDKLLLWADAVCINQGDDYEKGHQVRMMAQIYQEAKHVTVWLGKEDTYSAFAMESFQTIYKSKHFSSLSAIAASDDSIGEPRLRRLNSGLNALLKEFDLFNILAAAWHTLSPREWWSRLWVIQEVALAKQAYLKCGSSQLSWTVFRSIVLICDWLLECKPRHRDSNKLARLRNLAMMTLDCSQNVRLERSMSLLYLLGVLSSTSTTQQRTSDHRDRIYALLGMASDVAYLNVEPEYNLHWIKVYTETTIALLKAHGPMILSYCVPADEHRRHPDLPSWVPDWRRMIRHPLQGWDASFNYKACGSPRNDLPTASISPAKILSIRGAVFDQVSFVGQTPRGNRFSVLESREDITIAISNFKREYIRRTEDTKHATWRPSTKRYEEEALWRAPAANQILRAGTEGPCYSAETEDAIGYNALLESGANAFASNEPRILDYCWSIWRIMRGRRLFASARGYIGIASRQITPRDVICVLLGADVPFILRENSKGLFKFIGEAYVHGVMDGEFMDSNPEIRTFDIE